jgi:lipopolysaccharide biosynthesis glycosyltransferase
VHGLFAVGPHLAAKLEDIWLVNPGARLERHRPRIAVAYICDRKYHDITLYSIASIARSHRYPLDFFFLQSGYRAAIPPPLAAFIGSRGHSVERLEAPRPGGAAKLEAPGERNREKHSHISGTALLKANAIEALAHSHDYILYIDGDTLAFGDLGCEALCGFAETAGVCLDLAIGTGADDPLIFRRCEQAGISPFYFNSGFMLINAAKWRETNALSRFAGNFARHQRQCPYLDPCPTHDQCVFNMTFQGDVVELPMTLNVQKCALQTELWRDALLRHYTGPYKFLPVRPWRCDRREHALLRSISRETGLPAPGLYDLGLSYSLNGLRRRKAVASYERAFVTAASKA